MAAFAAQKDSMVTSETAAFQNQENLEALTRATLSTETGIHTIQYPSYQAYVKEVGRISGHFRGGSAMISEIELCVSKWATRGLVYATLAKLALEIFDIVVTPAPSGHGK
jgi:hypothetical protein